MYLATFTLLLLAVAPSTLILVLLALKNTALDVVGGSRGDVGIATDNVAAVVYAFDTHYDADVDDDGGADAPDAADGADAADDAEDADDAVGAVDADGFLLLMMLVMLSISLLHWLLSCCSWGC